MLLVDLGDELFVGWEYAEVFLFHEEFEVGEDFFFPFVCEEEAFCVLDSELLYFV